MRAAIYARRSTDEHQAASLDVQVGEAKRYIESKGWTVGDAHIYVEDAVSRAEFKKRPALIGMLNAVDAGALDIVVTRDETRLGGDVNRTGLLIQELLDSGAELFYYFTDERVTLDGAVEKFLVSARNFASELEREKISQRTREHLLTKARQGLNPGGRCYGFDNLRTEGRVEYRINEEQAEVVREIFARFADGNGFAAIARGLNERGVPPPRAGRRGTGSWSPSCVRAMLHNDRYRGVIVWGRYKKMYKGGTKVRVKQPDCDCIKIEMPELQLIDDELWAACIERLEKNRKRYGKAAKSGTKARHLLSGLARCAECGGPIRVETSKFGSANVKVYACSYNRTRGKSVCINGMRRPIAGINTAIVDWIKENVLTEELVVETLRVLRRRLEARAKTAQPDLRKLVAEAKKLRSEIANLADALASMGRSKALTAKLGERELRLERIEGQIEAARAAPSAIDLETRRMEHEAKDRLVQLRDLLDKNPEEARKAMEALLEGPLTFTAIRDDEGPRYRIQGKIATGEVICPIKNVPKGI